MGAVTSIQIPPATRDRLRKYGLKGQTYAQILDNLMARVDYDAFMEEQYAQLEQRDDFVPLEGL